MPAPRPSLTIILLVLGSTLLPLTRTPLASPVAITPVQTEATATTASEGSQANREMVMIDAQEYAVPRPWAGNKVAVPADTLGSLQRIPPELALNQGEIHLRSEVIEPLKAMAEAARKDQVTLVVDSGYRSTRYQRQIFRQFLKKGHKFIHISRNIAPPGYSEHALGTVVDFAPSSHKFAKSKAYAWLKLHAEMYGFYETMPRANQNSGTPWEPWHWKFRLPQIPSELVPPPAPAPEAEPPAKPEIVETTPPQRTTISIRPTLTFDPLPPER